MHGDFLVRIERFFGRKRLTDVVMEAIEKRNQSKKTSLRKTVSAAIDDLATNLKKKRKALPSKTARDTARPLTAFLIGNASGQQSVIEALLRIWMEQRPAAEIASIDAALSLVGLSVTIDGPEGFFGSQWSEESWAAFRDALKLHGARFLSDFAALS